MPKPENIVPHKWKKGQTGNPKGRPKLPDLSEALAEVLGNDDGLKRVIRGLQKKAEQGDAQAAKLLLDRGYGLQRQDVGIEGNITLTLITDTSDLPTDK